MKRRILTVIAATGAMIASQAAAERFTADSIVFEDVTGAIEIVTASIDEIDITIEQGKTYRQVTAVLDADGILRIKGEPWKEADGKDCCNDRIRRTYNARKDRTLSKNPTLKEDFFTDYPTIKVTMPRDTNTSFIDARMTIAMDDISAALNLDACYVYGEIGDVDEAVVGMLSGSRLVLGDVAGMLEVDLSGDADLLTGAAAMADIDIAGAGDAILGTVDGMMDVSIAGSGLARAARLQGPLTVRIAGSGAVAVRSGQAKQLRATIDGSGALYFDGSAHQPDLRLFGSPEVRLGQVTGRMKHVGGGDVYVASELIEKN